MDKNNYCSLKYCRLRKCLEEIPEDKRDYSEDYPFNSYGFECHVPCKIRVKDTQKEIKQIMSDDNTRQLNESKMQFGNLLSTVLNNDE